MRVVTDTTVTRWAGFGGISHRRVSRSLVALLLIDQIMRIFENKRAPATSALAHEPGAGAERSASYAQIVRARGAIQYACVAILGVGFVAYALRQMKNQGASFRWTTLLLGTAKCRGV